MISWEMNGKMDRISSRRLNGNINILIQAPDQGEFHNSNGFSDFFEAFLEAKTGQQGRPNDFAYGSWNLRGQDHEAKIEISLEEAYSGATKGISLQSFEIDAEGQVTPVTRNYQVKIPKGISDGTRIRMTGKGGPGVNSGPPGDLFLKVNFIPHPRFKAVGNNLNMDVPITPLGGCTWVHYNRPAAGWGDTSENPGWYPIR
jgi:curved DNA-binding protein